MACCAVALRVPVGVPTRLEDGEGEVEGEASAEGVSEAPTPRMRRTICSGLASRAGSAERRTELVRT